MKPLTIVIKIQSLNKSVKLSSSRHADILTVSLNFHPAILLVMPPAQVKEQLLSKACLECQVDDMKIVHYGKVLSDKVVVQDILEKR